MSRMRAACRRKTRSLFENKESQKICGFSGFQFSREGGRSGNRHFAAVVLRPSRSDFKSEKREKCATATTAACGGCREELLGQRPAGCECRPRHEADAGCRNPSAPARRNRCDLAALNTRHLLRKPVCGLKVPLGLSCPAGTAVLSGSLLSVKREHLRPVKHFPENPKLSLSVQKTFLSLHRSTQKVASCRIDTESLTKNIIFCILSLSALA